MQALATARARQTWRIQTGIVTVAAFLIAIVIGSGRGLAAGPTQYWVTTTNDSGPGSLREAIELSNSDGEPTNISFRIPPGDHGFNGQWATITLRSPLPVILDTGTVIDGDSAFGSRGDLNPFGPEIFLDGRALTAGQAFVLQSDRNVIRGLVLSGFPYQAILIQKGFPAPGPVRGNVIRGNYIGADPTGTAAIPNGCNAGRAEFDSLVPALSVAMGVDTVIGGPQRGEGNLVSGNCSFGIDVVSGSVRTLLQGNRVGTDRTGTRALPNGGHGVNLGEFGGQGADNLVGGTAPGSGNLISGNGGDGVFVVGSGHVIEGNLIGTDATGTLPLGNQGNGVAVRGGSNIRIGGATPASRNVISGNGGSPVKIESSDNLVQGNYLGVDVTGARPLGNARGIDILGPTSKGGVPLGPPASRNRIIGNVVSGNGGTDGGGVQLAFAEDNVIQGNLIGTDAAGTAALGNRFGVHMGTLSTRNLIGGPTPAERNVVSGNQVGGMKLGGTDNTVQGNYVGLDVTGQRAIGNGFGFHPGGLGPGISLVQPFAGNPPARGFTVTGNVISGNAGPGLHLGGDSARVTGNLIGTDASGSLAVANGEVGISVRGTENIVGGTSSADRNLISGNTDAGIRIGPSSARTTVQGNFIGTDASGIRALGNGRVGVLIVASSDNTIGGTVSGARNVISGNGDKGVLVGASSTGASSTGNFVQGNYIGVDASGTSALGNGCQGVAIQRSFRNTVGGTIAGARNVISGNGTAAPVPGCVGSGVFIQGADPFTPGTATDNVVQGNYVGTDVTGTIALGNTHSGVAINFASHNLVGGTEAGAGNLISGNRGAGVAIAGPGVATTGNVVQANRIGTDQSGTGALGNGLGVEINGGASGNKIGGIDPGAGNVVSGNAGSGVRIRGGAPGFDSAWNIVQGNLIGTDAAGARPLANGGTGIQIEGGATDTLVGGLVPAARNVISGNRGAGISVGRGNRNVVEGNHIGVDATGTAPLGNRGQGVVVFQSSGNTIGGADPGAANVIGANARSGVALTHSTSTGNVVEGNFIGTDRTRTRELGNGGGCLPSLPASACGLTAGVGITNGASDNTVAGNTIAFNRTAGVALVVTTLLADPVDPLRNRITRNSIYGNVGADVFEGLGIALGFDGVTPNDPGDTDTGPNALQNFPVLFMAIPAGDKVVVRGSIDSPNPATITVELFGNDAADPSGHGEGQRFAAAVTPSANGCFTVQIDRAMAGSYVTATATDAAGNTSEFSAAIAVRAGRPAAPPRCGG